MGELCVRGPQVMSGYSTGPRRPPAVLRDGWLYTGDVASMDAEGYFTIVDRVKDLIIVSGANVYPSEVEEVLLAHPAVAEAAVIGDAGRATGRGAQGVRGAPRGSDASTWRRLLEHCRANLSPYKVPAEIEVRSELPKTMIGKVLRKDLRAEVEART